MSAANRTDRAIVSSDKAMQARINAINESERALLAQFLLAPVEAMNTIVPLLGDGSAFTGRNHQVIYDAARKLGPECSIPQLCHDLIGRVDASYASSLSDGEWPLKCEAIRKLCRTVLDEERRRALNAIYLHGKQSLDSGLNPYEVQDDVLARVTALPVRRGSLSDLVLWGSDLENAEVAEVHSLVGGGLLTRGDYSVLIGPKGMGKTWLTLDLAGRVAKGEPFFGLTTQKSRVLIISLEMKTGDASKRLRALGHCPLPDNLGVIGKEKFFPQGNGRGARRLPRLSEAADQEELVDLVMQSGADLVCIDPIGVTMTRENEELPGVASFLVDLATRTDCHVWTAHHVRKPGEPHSRLRIVDSRGPTQLTDWSACVLTIGKSRGQIVFGHPEDSGPRHRGPIDDVWLERLPEGPFAQVDAPRSQEDEAEMKRTAIQEMLHERGSIRVPDAAQRLGCSEECIRKHLKVMGAKRHGGGRTSEWVLAEEESPTPKLPIPNNGDRDQLPF